MLTLVSLPQNRFMFYNAKIGKLGLNTWKTSAAKTMRYMFAHSTGTWRRARGVVPPCAPLCRLPSPTTTTGRL